MNKVYAFLLSLAHNEWGQDMVEYALLAGFIAVAAGAVFPPAANGISVIFSRMDSIAGAAAS
jgi:Flp pilus assembly pilin Flp